MGPVEMVEQACARGAIGQAAQDREQVAGQAEVIVAKQRNGPVGEVELVWRKEYTRFEDKAPERLDEFDGYADTDEDAEFGF